MEWELGAKANPLKPAYPGIKPEWYFLSVYQMLREFPAHLLGMEGPQACLLLASILGAIAFAIPLLDRNAAKGKPSPLFTDLGVAGLLFLGFLTLKAWDVGVHAPHGKDPAGDPVMAATIARTAALWIIGIGARRDGAPAPEVGALGLRLHRRRPPAGGAERIRASELARERRSSPSPSSRPCSSPAGAARRVRGGRSSVSRSSRPPRRAPTRRRRAGAAPAPAIASAAAGHVVEDTWPADFRKLFDGSGQEDGPGPRARRPGAIPEPAHPRAGAVLRGGEGGHALVGGTHLATLLALDIDDRKVELILGDNCVLCHSNPDLPDEILFKPREKGDPNAHLDLREIVSDVHFRGGLMCAGCHGGKPTDAEMSAEIAKRWPTSELRHKDRSWIPEFCARCHSSSEFMRSYNPSLPVDQLLKYRTSKHGQLLLGKKDSKAAQCVSCHGVHGIRPPRQHELPRLPREHPGDVRQVPRGRGLHEGLHARRREDAAPDEPARAVQEERPRARTPREARRRRPGLQRLPRQPRGAASAGRRSSRRSAETATRQTGVSSTGARTRRRSRSTAGPSARRATESTTSCGPRTRCSRDDPQGLCHACHAKYGKPKCDETARFFYATITSLRESHEALENDVDRLLERGFDVDELRFQSSAVNDALRKTRLGIHTFDRSDFTRNSDATSQAETGSRRRRVRVWAEYRFRRNGLLLATVHLGLRRSPLSQDPRGGGRP